MPSFPGNARHIYIYTSLQFAAAFFPFSRPANATYVSLRSMYLSLFPAFCRMFCFLLPSHTKSGLSGGQFDWHCFIAKTGEVRGEIFGAPIKL